MTEEVSKYLRLDRSVVAKQLAYCTGQNPSHRTENSQTDGFLIRTYGQRAVLVRWVGPLEEETKNLNRYEQALQRSGYRVRRMTEENVEPHTQSQRDEQKARRNREVLHATKLKPEFASPKRRTREVIRGGVRTT